MLCKSEKAAGKFSLRPIDPPPPLTYTFCFYILLTE